MMILLKRGSGNQHKSWFSCGPILVKLEFEDVGFCGSGRQNWRTQRKSLKGRQEPTTNETHKNNLFMLSIYSKE